MTYLATFSRCVLAISVLLVVSVSHAQDTAESVRVGIYQNPPKVFADESGEPAGFWVDVLEAIADAEGWSLDYVPCQWQACLRQVERGQLDLMVDVAYSEERDRRFAFNTEVVLTSWSTLYTRPGVKADSVFNLHQRPVAVLRDSIQYETLVALTRSLDIQPHYVEVEGFDEMFQLLDQQQVDFAAVNNFFGERNAQAYNVVETGITLNPARLHFVGPTVGSGALLTTIDRRLRQLIANSNSVYYQSLERWLEPAGRFGWRQVWQIAVEMLIYAPFIGLVAIAIWNRFLSREVHRRRETEAALRESQARLQLVTENMGDLVCLHDPDGRYLYVTPSSQAVIGYAPGELLGRHPQDLLAPEDREWLQPVLGQLANAVGVQPLTYRAQTKTGREIWLETLVHPIYDAQGQLLNIQTTSRDVSDRVRAERQLKHQAFHDDLTDLPNRFLLGELLQQAVQQNQTDPAFQFALLCLDLDNFKAINDSLGHRTGDALLQAVAQLLCTTIREIDVAARLGGDEFAIALGKIADLEDAARIAERILVALRSPLIVGEREIFISASIGIAIGNGAHRRAEELLRDADLAMYRAKQSGRDQYAIFDPAMHDQALRRLQLEHDLRQALDRGEFRLYYQPIVKLSTQRIYGFEALIRWQHPQRGLVPPDEFIPIAEETGLIVPMGWWILHTAGQQLATWHAQFPDKPLKISVNISVQQLQPRLLTQLDEVLATYQLPRDRLVLEITESRLVQNVEPVHQLLTQIQARGIGISIDDFGTGYSSLSYLHRLPVNALKIDRAFVALSARDTRNQTIAESIVTLSNLLELNAIAEGIENYQQLYWLQRLGCELGQGFLFSPPLAAAAATRLLAEWNFSIALRKPQD